MGIAIPAFLGMRSRAKVIAVVRAYTTQMRMSLDQAKLESGSFPAGGTYTWSLITGHVQFPGPNPLPGFQPAIPPPGYDLELKLTIPTGSQTYFIQVRDPTTSHNYFQVDQSGAETTF